IEGEPGIGKSTLLAAGLAQARPLGCEVFWESADQARQRFPLWVLLDCLRVGSRSTDAVRAEIAGLLRGEGSMGLTPADTTAVEAVHVVGRLVAAAPGPKLRRLAGQAGGNPLYLQELVDALLREEGVRVAAGVAELVGTKVPRPASLAAAITRRLRFLSEPAGAAVQVAALLGPEFPIEHMRVATGRSGSELAAVVREATAAGVLAEAGAGGRLVVRHGLIQQALYEEIAPPVRAGLHRHLAQVLADAGAPVERVAEHLLAAPKVADAWVMDWVTQVAQLLVYRAPQIAVDLLQRVREMAVATDPRLESLNTSLVTALFQLSR